MNKLITENYFQTNINNEVLSNSVWEIQIHLWREPVWQFGVVILDYDDISKREEIFYHRKSWATIYTYDINRKQPRTHSIWASCVMNDSASIFNFLSDNTYTHFYIYKKSINEVYVFGWKVYKDSILINIEDKLIDIYNWTNYIYLDDDDIIKSSLINPTWKIVVWLVTKSWSSITIEKYNIIWFGSKWDEWVSIESINKTWTVWLVDTYTVYMNDWSTYTYNVTNGVVWWDWAKWDKGDKWDPWESWTVIPLPTYTTSWITTNRVIDNSITLWWIKDVLWTLITDIQDWLEAIGSPWVWIQSITKTWTVGLVDTYTITYTNWTTSTYTVTNWAEWQPWSWWTNKYCSATITSNETVGSVTWTQIYLDNFITNDNWMSVNNGMIVITESWTYKIEAKLTFEFNSSWVREMYIFKWATEISTVNSNPVINWWYTSLETSVVINLNAWDFIRLRCFQTSWNTLNVFWWRRYTFLNVFKI